MQPNAGMVPKECGFHQSETASCSCARGTSRFLCSPAMARYCELLQTEYYCHHADMIRHARHVTTKLYETSACGCNQSVTIKRYFRTSYFPVSYRRRMYPGSAEALATLRKSQDGDTDEFIICLLILFNLSIKKTNDYTYCATFAGAASLPFQYGGFVNKKSRMRATTITEHLWIVFIILVDMFMEITFAMHRGRRGMSARLRLNAPWLENSVRQDCDISHSEWVDILVYGMHVTRV